MNGQLVTLDSDTQPEMSPLKKWVLLGLGVFFVALALAGAILPLLPTTPFLLVAGACLARSSPRLHEKLLNMRVFGPYLKQWRRERTVPREAKLKAYGLIGLTFSISIYLLEPWWLRLGLALIAAILIFFIHRLETSKV